MLITQRPAAYSGASTVDVSGHSPCEVLAVTDALAVEVSADDGGVVGVLVLALRLAERITRLGPGERDYALGGVAFTVGDAEPIAGVVGGVVCVMVLPAPPNFTFACASVLPRVTVSTPIARTTNPPTIASIVFIRRFIVTTPIRSDPAPGRSPYAARPNQMTGVSKKRTPPACENPGIGRRPYCGNNLPANRRMADKRYCGGVISYIDRMRWRGGG